MQAGEIVEAGPADEIYENPQKEYTRSLIDAIPKDSLEHIERRQAERLAAVGHRSRNIS